MGSKNVEELLSSLSIFVQDLSQIIEQGKYLKNDLLEHQKSLTSESGKNALNRADTEVHPNNIPDDLKKVKCSLQDECSSAKDDVVDEDGEESVQTINLDGSRKGAIQNEQAFDIHPGKPLLSKNICSQDEVDLISKLTADGEQSPRFSRICVGERKLSTAWTQDSSPRSSPETGSPQDTARSTDSLIFHKKTARKKSAQLLLKGLEHLRPRKMSVKRTVSKKHDKYDESHDKNSVQNFGDETKMVSTPKISMVVHDTSVKEEWHKLKLANDASNKIRNHGLRSFVSKNSQMDLATEMNTLSKITDGSPGFHHRRKRKRKIVSMDGVLRRAWDSLLSVGTLYVAFSVPYTIGFRYESVDWSVDWITVVNEIAFILDIPLMASTSYIEPETKEEIKDPSKVLKNYMANYFCVDFMSCVPWDSIFLILKSQNVNSFNYLPLLSLIRFWKLYSRSLWEKTNIYFTKHGANPAVIRMTALVVIFMLVVHWYACLYWFIHIRVGYSESWAPLSSSKGRTYQYIESVYFALSSVGGNHMGPLAVHENLLASLGMLIAFMVNATLIGSATIVLSNLDSTAVAKKQQADTVRDYLKYRRTPKYLQHKILAYYEYVWETGKTPSSTQILQELPRKLRLELSVTLHRRLIEQVPLFKACSSAGVILLIKNLTQMVVLPHELVIRQGELGTTMYFISRGSVRCTTSLSDGAEAYLVTLAEGSYFGEMALIDNRSVRTANIRAIHFCELQVLSASDFKAVLEAFPDFKRAVDQIADARLKLLNVIHSGKSNKMRKMGLRRGFSSKSTKKGFNKSGYWTPENSEHRSLRDKVSSLIGRSRNSSAILASKEDTETINPTQQTLYESVLKSQEGLSHDTAAKMRDTKSLSLTEFVAFEHAVATQKERNEDENDSTFSSSYDSRRMNTSAF